MIAHNSSYIFTRLVQKFFSERLINQQNVSSKTVAAYRDTFRLLFQFIKKQNGCSPSDLTLSNLNADLILDFLNYLEEKRGNCIRTRNARLAAIRAFFQFAALEEPEEAARVNRVLAIPMKRFDRPSVKYLSKEEINTLLSALDKTTWIGRRDFAMFTTMYNTGARVSELIGICLKDVSFSQSSGSVSLHGKGRKERTIPLWKSTTAILKKWKREISDYPGSPMFPNANGRELSRLGVEFRLRCSNKKAGVICSSLRTKSVSPHVIRHTIAMHILHSGVDLSVIALWLGHESIQTTHMYMEADLKTKEKALSLINSPKNKSAKFKPKDKLLQFLEGL